MKTRREEVGLNDLAAVLDAALLLRKYGLVSAEEVRKVRKAVNEDAQVHLDRYTGCDEAQRIANEAYRRTAGGPF